MLAEELERVCSQSLEDLGPIKISMSKHPMKQVLLELLCNIKQRTGPTLRNMLDEEPSDPQLERLNNMLAAEGVSSVASGQFAMAAAAAGQSPNEGVIENSDYKGKLAQIRSVYHNELTRYQEACKEFTHHVKTLLTEHAKLRPISPVEIERMVMIVQKRFNAIEIQLKQSTCEAVMILRSRFLDARRKRRNFSKQATEVLNEYFYSHLANPYPSEEAKEQLARTCGITVSQVSNWFGNKRIRYKKNIGKAQEEANLYAARRAAGESPYGMTPSSHGSGGNMMSSPEAHGSTSQDAWSNAHTNGDYKLAVGDYKQDYSSDGSENSFSVRNR